MCDRDANLWADVWWATGRCNAEAEQCEKYANMKSYMIWLQMGSLKIYNKFATIFVNWNFQEILTKDPSSAWGCDTSGNIPPCRVAL